MTDGDPPDLTPLEQGQRDFHGCLWGAAGALAGLALCAALALAGGTAGRAVVAALGFAVAGFFLPWFAGGGEPHGANQERFMLVLCGLCALGGLVLGAVVGSSGEELTWWTPPAALAAAAGLGAWGGVRIHRKRHPRPPRME